MPERYITNSASLDRDALADGFNKVLELCISLSHNAVILHLPIKNHLRQLSNLLGQTTIRRLNKDNYSSWNRITFNLNTERLEISDWTEDIVLSLYPTSRMIDNLNNLNRAKAIVFVPGIERERAEWIKTWNPEIIGGAQENVGSLELDPRLERALVSLTSMINLSTGLTHSSDRESTIQLLRILHRKRIQLNPNNLRIWALQNGWNSDGANQLQDYAQGVLEGRQYRTSGVNIWSDKYIKELLEN